MRLLLLLGFALSLCLNTHYLAAQQSIDIDDGSITGFGGTSLGISMSTTVPVEGFVLAISFDSALLSATDVSTKGIALSAELQVPEIFSNGATLGVVMDSESPFDGQTIPVGGGEQIASLSLTSVASVLAPTDTAVSFLDGVLNNPPLDNILVQGGLSVGVGEGLDLNGGTMTVFPVPPNDLAIESTSADADGEGDTGDARILMSNQSGAVQGFVLAITHDGTSITLESISIEGTITQATGAEFTIPQLFPGGGTLGIVLDFNAPFDGQTIATGDNQHIASFRYSCNSEILEPDPNVTTALSFSDGTLGNPALNNVLVIDGLSFNPELVDGTFTCLAVPPPPPEDTVLCMDTFFDNDNGNYAWHGQTGKLAFRYSDEDGNIQGMTLTVCYDCDLTIQQGTLDLNGSIVEEVGAEFVNHQVDDDCSDGETGELIIAILLDAVPPYENQTLPTTSELLLVACIDVTVDDTAECDAEQEIYFCNGINGNGNVSLYNNVVIDYESVQDYLRCDTSVLVVPREMFQRGDCNSDDKVDLADAATMLAQQFQGYQELCADACDANDDGLINLADSVFTLGWLFQFGPEPPAPGPYDDGPDPTTDDELPVCDSNDTTC
ncbi:MAG TPA: hypothetical protein EYN79_00850 [Planctomycetes bacterium]|nr:hypothetical protein [Planctomycetota bacterium]